VFLELKKKKIRIGPFFKKKKLQKKNIQDRYEQTSDFVPILVKIDPASDLTRIGLARSQDQDLMI